MTLTQFVLFFFRSSKVHWRHWAAMLHFFWGWGEMTWAHIPEVRVCFKAFHRNLQRAKKKKIYICPDSWRRNNPDGHRERTLKRVGVQQMCLFLFFLLRHTHVRALEQITVWTLLICGHFGGRAGWQILLPGSFKPDKLNFVHWLYPPHALTFDFCLDSNSWSRERRQKCGSTILRHLVVKQLLSSDCGK